MEFTDAARVSASEPSYLCARDLLRGTRRIDRTGSVSESSVVVLVADGVRPDTLRSAIDAGELPALAALRAEGAGHVIATSFPSVSIVGYAPLLVGRHPGRAGLPGLRWFDRHRGVSRWLGHSRSYVGLALRRIDRDLDPAAPTAFELFPGRSLGALSGIARGLAPRNRLDSGLRFATAASWHHVRGDVQGWLDLDRRVGERLVTRVRRERPRFVFAAFPACDKASHATGHASPLVREALRTVDAVAAALRRDAEQDGRWRGLRLWVVSDHGHSPVRHHDDLAATIRAWGLAVRAHPWTTPRRADVAVMVSGNAMAHLFLELEARERPWWPALRDRWESLAQALVARPSVDLLGLPLSPGRVEVRACGRGSAILELANDRYSHRPIDGDPLGAGEFEGLGADEVLERTAAGTYPDAPVQLAALCAAARCGDIVISAAPGWDLREKYEPLPHVSTHGSLHRDHLLVPLLLSHPVAGQPRRAVDLFPSMLRVLGASPPPGIDGAAFL